MARSIKFGGHDFSSFSTAEVVLPAAHGIVVDAAEVPGRAGAVLLSARIPPKTLRVRLFLDLKDDEDAAGLSAVRHEAASWLAPDAGGDLELPGEPGLVYRDTVCTDAGTWDALFEDGSCELVFTAFDPVAWGQEREASAAAGSAELSLLVGGTYRTWPTFVMEASAGSSVVVEDVGAGARVEVERAFLGGEEVVVDCSAGRAWVDGEAADADVTLDSDFFWLEPGSHELSFTGCADFTTNFTERWL